MEKFKEKEISKKYKGKIESLIEMPDGVMSIDFGPQPDIDGDIRGFLLTPELQEKLGIKGLLAKDMEVIVTTDQNDRVINIERILQ